MECRMGLDPNNTTHALMQHMLLNVGQKIPIFNHLYTRDEKDLVPFTLTATWFRPLQFQETAQRRMSIRMLRNILR